MVYGLRPRASGFQAFHGDFNNSPKSLYPKPYAPGVAFPGFGACCRSRDLGRTPSQQARTLARFLELEGRCRNPKLVLLRIYIHSYIRAYTHAYIHTYLHRQTDRQTDRQTCIHAYMHTCIRAYIDTYMHTCRHAYMCACIYIYRHLLTHTFIQTDIHTYIHTWSTDSQEHAAALQGACGAKLHGPRQASKAHQTRS